MWTAMNTEYIWRASLNLASQPWLLNFHLFTNKIKVKIDWTKIEVFFLENFPWRGRERTCKGRNFAKGEFLMRRILISLFELFHQTLCLFWNYFIEIKRSSCNFICKHSTKYLIQFKRLIYYAHQNKIVEIYCIHHWINWL